VGKFAIPTRRQSNTARVGGRRKSRVQANADRAIRHLESAHADRRHRANRHLLAADVIQFLGQRHLVHDLVNALTIGGRERMGGLGVNRKRKQSAGSYSQTERTKQRQTIEHGQVPSNKERVRS
jgi:hypothetical protein